MEQTTEAAKLWRDHVRQNVLRVYRTVSGKKKLQFLPVCSGAEGNEWAEYLERMGLPVAAQAELLDPEHGETRSVKTPWEAFHLHRCEVSSDDVANYSKAGIRSLGEMQWLSLEGMTGRIYRNYVKGGQTKQREILALHKTLFPVVSSELQGSGLQDRDTVAVVCSIVERLNDGMPSESFRENELFYSALRTFVADCAGTAKVSYGRVAKISIDNDELQGAIEAALFICG